MNLYSFAIHWSSFGVGVTAAMIEHTVTIMGAMDAKSDMSCRIMLYSLVPQ